MKDMKCKFWSRDSEKTFLQKHVNTCKREKNFIACLKRRLFYEITIDGRSIFVTYFPRGYEGKTSTIQGRNSLIGTYTEEFVQRLLTCVLKSDPTLSSEGYQVYTAVSCPELALSNRSKADAVIASKNAKPKRRGQTISLDASEILVVFEIKMSLVWNWSYNPSTDDLLCIGDYSTHQGNPGLLRSDSMLKAIGKAANIRVSGNAGSRIPIVVIGNTPITPYYHEKVDYLRKRGIIQGFWSINPNPGGPHDIKKTPEEGFVKLSSSSELGHHLNELLRISRRFISFMMPDEEVGAIILQACKAGGGDLKSIGREFIQLLNSK